MLRFSNGDVVRIVNSSSAWHGVRGMVVDVVGRNTSGGKQDVEEYAVKFGDDRRWFMAQHLVKAGPTNTAQFFCAEAIARWHLAPDCAVLLDGRRDRLAALLQDCCRFSPERAEIEVDEFLRILDNKVKRATA
jgi:hypothetical protein